MGLAASRQEAFWEACGFGNLERAKKLLADGDIDVNWVSYTNDCCPIHVASQGKPDIVQMLLDNNCNVNVRDIRENTAIHHAAMKGHADIIQTLIDAGIDINAQEKNGWTALHNAAYWCHPQAVRVLIKNKCDVNLQNKDERTALHETARSQQNKDDQLGEISRMLIDAGSDINAKSSDLGEADLTGLMYAAYHNHPEVAQALVDAECELNSVGTTFWTALHWAADRGHDEIVYILLEAGVDPTKKGMRGEMAMDRAQSEEIKEVLLNAVNMHKEIITLMFKESAAKKTVKPVAVNKPILQPVTTTKAKFCWERPSEGSEIVIGKKILGDIIPVKPKPLPEETNKRQTAAEKFRHKLQTDSDNKEVCSIGSSPDVSIDILTDKRDATPNDRINSGETTPCRETTPIDSIISGEKTPSSKGGASSSTPKASPLSDRAEDKNTNGGEFLKRDLTNKHTSPLPESDNGTNKDLENLKNDKNVAIKAEVNDTSDVPPQLNFSQTDVSDDSYVLDTPSSEVKTSAAVVTSDSGIDPTDEPNDPDPVENGAVRKDTTDTDKDLSLSVDGDKDTS